ncbi:YIP1 family protein [Sporosarcina koreensis]|uniref:YIP1 family protein n=1 Tax=Sporosarcina koreensis TaxID=334735 RepID=UPI00058B90C2|nr:YIP1 family protein [Sporosarcina koreensis]
MNFKPLVSIWSRPTDVLNYMKDRLSLKYAVAILALAALSTGGYQAGNTNLTSSLPLGVQIPLLIITTFVGALISWVIGSALYTWIGRGIFGGRGTFRDMLRVVPASSIPMIWMAPVNYAVIAVYGELAFKTPDPESLTITYLPLTVYLFVNFLTFALGIYAIVISSKGIGLVHGFSAWKGFGVNLLVLVAGFLIAALMILLFVFVFAFGM